MAGTTSALTQQTLKPVRGVGRQHASCCYLTKTNREAGPHFRCELADQAEPEVVRTDPIELG
jgi:hypothetical protein